MKPEVSFIQREPALRPEGAQSIVLRLRRETTFAHAELEGHLDLLNPVHGKARFRRVLLDFFGFHAVWEPWLDAAVDEPAFTAPRRRLHLLRTDLRNLGVPDSQLRTAPQCPWPEGGAFAEALGSMYVLEGSVLGGQIIAKHLSGADWLPNSGLTYFCGRGAATGPMWRGFKERLVVASGPSADERMVAGARFTFERLHRWLSRAQ